MWSCRLQGGCQEIGRAWVVASSESCKATARVICSTTELQNVLWIKVCGVGQTIPSIMKLVTRTRTLAHILCPCCRLGLILSYAYKILAVLENGNLQNMKECSNWPSAQGRNNRSSFVKTNFWEIVKPSMTQKENEVRPMSNSQSKVLSCLSLQHSFLIFRI